MDSATLAKRLEENARRVEEEGLTLPSSSQDEMTSGMSYFDLAAYTAAAAFVLARHIVNGQPLNKHMVMHVANKHKVTLLRVLKQCQDRGIPIHEYVELQCKCFPKTGVYVNALASDAAFNRWDRNHRKFFPKYNYFTPPNLDEYTTGLETLLATRQRMSWAISDPECLFLVSIPTLPMGYLVESTTVRRLVESGEVQPEELRLQIEKAMRERGDLNLRGDGL